MLSSCFFFCIWPVESYCIVVVALFVLSTEISQSFCRGPIIVYYILKYLLVGNYTNERVIDLLGLGLGGNEGISLLNPVIKFIWAVRNRLINSRRVQYRVEENPYRMNNFIPFSLNSSSDRRTPAFSLVIIASRKLDYVRLTVLALLVLLM